VVRRFPDSKYARDASSSWISRAITWRGRKWRSGVII
jgi:hypothetical protein